MTASPSSELAAMKTQPPPNNPWLPAAYNGGPARQQFRQKREPSEFRQFFQLQIEESDFYPKMTALVKL